MEETEIDDDYIRNYLQQQSEDFFQPFVEKKAQLSDHQDIEQEFGELLGEITKDEEIIKTLIELASFLLDKTKLERINTEEVREQWQDNVLQINQKVELETQIAKQFQKMYSEQQQKVSIQLQTIERHEHELQERDEQIILLSQMSKSSKFKKSFEKKETKQQMEDNLLQIEEHQQKLILQLKSTKEELKDGKNQVKESKIQIQCLEEQIQQIMKQMQDSMRETIQTNNQKIQLEQRLRQLEQEFTNVCDETQNLEEEIVVLRDNEVNYKKQIHELLIEQGYTNKLQVTSFINSSRQFSITNSPQNLQNELFGFNKIHKQNLSPEDGKSKYQRTQTIQEQDEGGGMIFHIQQEIHLFQKTENQQLDPHHGYNVGVQDQLKLMTNQQDNLSPIPIISKVSGSQSLSFMQEKRLGKLKIKLNIASRMSSQVNTPREEVSLPATQKFSANNSKHLKSSSKQIDEDFEVYVDGHIEQKYFPKFSKPVIQMPKIKINLNPKLIYDSFIEENQEYFQMDQQDKVRHQHNINQMQTSNYGPTLEINYQGQRQLRRLATKTFAQPDKLEIPVNLTKLIDKQIGLRQDSYEEFFKLVENQFIKDQLMCQTKFSIYGPNNYSTYIFQIIRLKHKVYIKQFKTYVSRLISGTNILKSGYIKRQVQVKKIVPANSRNRLHNKRNKIITQLNQIIYPKNQKSRDEDYQKQIKLN